jgi:CPA2 family monovalent cation:H+ antiporter-2
VALLGWSLSRSFHRVYTAAQASLIETLAPKPPAAELPRPHLLAESDLLTVTVGENAVGAGCLIRELALRSRTGASIVAVERGTDRLINPGADEEIRPGDRVLLLGHPDQLVAARGILAEEKKA